MRISNFLDRCRTPQSLRNFAAVVALLSFVILGAPDGGHAQARSRDNGAADANLVSPIKVTITRELDFGKWVINEKDAMDNWVTLSDDGNNTLTWGAGVQQIAKNSNPAENGIVSVVGVPNANFTITTTLISISPQEGTLVLSSPATGTFDATGHATYYIGGTWTWTTNGDANNFDAIFSSVVNYD